MIAERDDRRGASGHPETLPWYVSGNIDREEARDIEGHLKDCPECREEVRALASMRRTLLRHGRADDVSLEELLDRLPEGAEGSRRPTIAGSPARRSPKLWRGGLAAAAAMAALLVVYLVRQSGREPVAPPHLAPAHAITLRPPQRGEESEGVLQGNGPWSVTVVLPFGAPEGTYRLHVERADGRTPEDMTASAPADPAGTLTVLFRSLPPAGRYRLVLESPAGPGAGVFEYRFRVAGPAPGSPP